MKRKKLTIALVASTLALVLMLATLSVYAYFSTQVYVYTDTGREVAKVGMNLQLLFGKLTGVAEGTDLKIPSYNVVDADGRVVTPANKSYWANVAGQDQYLHFNDGVTDTTKYDPSAPWGSAQNPYVISEARHMQNLSALQSVGYFDLLYIRNNFKSGTYAAGSANIPYFVVCNVDGTPVTIDGSDLDPIKPIGSAEHPFIGVIGGAFAAGETIVAGKTSSVSAIHGFKIQTNTNQTDVGLFGYVGYLGVEPSDATAGTKFFGVASSIQNILLSDVQVVVKNPTIAEIASSLLGHVFNNHRFSYTGVKDSGGNQIPTSIPPHENHHIGIFAGHISYAQAEYISVYYSSEDKCAIDLLHATSSRTENYHSSTGIVGFMHNMNSTISNQSSSTTTNGTTTTKYSGHCQISYGGITSSGVSITPDTPGAGGGDEIGLGRGYVVAKTLYEGYHYISGNQGLYDRIWKYTATVNGEAKVYYGPMFYEQSNGSFVTQNGEAVTIDANGVATYTAGGTAKSFKIYSKRTAASATTYTYTLYDGMTSVVSFSPDATNNVELPQSVWQYVLKKPTDANGNPIENQGQWTWNEAVLVVEKSTDSYILKETRYTKNAAGQLVSVVNEYPVALGAGTATITGATYSDGNTGVTISNVILSRTVDNETKYFVYNTATKSWVEPEFFREKPLKLVNATTSLGTALCIQSESSNGKYFYDGVFTFALSDPNDTIASTWENETPDEVVLGPNDNDAWQANPEAGYYGVVAYIKLVEDLDDFQTLAENNTPIFIGYQDSDGQLHLLTLLETNSAASGWNILSNNFYSAVSNTKSFFDDTERGEILDVMSQVMAGSTDANMTIDDIAAGQTIETLYNGVIDGTIQLLNLETASDLTKLKNYYKITPSVSGNGYQFAQGETKLAILRSHYTSRELIKRYSIYSGTKAPDSIKDPTGITDYYYHFRWNTVASVGFSNNAFNISYTYDSEERFLEYNADGDCFDGIGSANETSNLYFYTIEAMSSVKSGQVVYEPVEGKTSTNTFAADQYVLWPNAVMDQNGSYINGTYYSSNETNYHDAGDTVTDGNGDATLRDAYRTYKLMSLQDLYDQDAGWQDGRGNGLSNINLRKKFTMVKAIDFSFNLNIPWFGIGNVQANDKSVVAPVGRGGASSNIPTGGVAFRINETTTEGSHIYVIVSVPVSKFYDEASPESLHTAADYYLGLWQTQDIDDDAFSYNTFNQTTAVQKFELPRSRPYNPENATVANSDYILVEHGGTTYRCYLNGDRVLVAYRFTVMEAGTYILGTAIGQSSIGNAYSYSYPMEIVYCAADGTASEGLDGTIGSVTGALDYVYAYGGNIVNVQDYTGTVPTGDYTYYYSSRIVTYTDNGNTAINDMMIYPYRYVADNKIYLNMKVLSGDSQFYFTYKRTGTEPDEYVPSTGTRPSP